MRNPDREYSGRGTSSSFDDEVNGETKKISQLSQLPNNRPFGGQTQGVGGIVGHRGPANNSGGVQSSYQTGSSSYQNENIRGEAGC